MKFALVIFEWPSDAEASKRQLWDPAVQTDLSRKNGVSDVRMINNAVYLCDIQHGLGSLSFVIEHAQRHNIATSTLFFEEEPNFIHSDGKSIKI